jgi:hypothetical protein
MAAEELGVHQLGYEGSEYPLACEGYHVCYQCFDNTESVSVHVTITRVPQCRMYASISSTSNEVCERCCPSVLNGLKCNHRI